MTQPCTVKRLLLVVLLFKAPRSGPKMYSAVNMSDLVTGKLEIILFLMYVVSCDWKVRNNLILDVSKKRFGGGSTDHPVQFPSLYNL